MAPNRPTHRHSSDSRYAVFQVSMAEALSQQEIRIHSRVERQVVPQGTCGFWEIHCKSRHELCNSKLTVKRPRITLITRINSGLPPFEFPVIPLPPDFKEFLQALNHSAVEYLLD